MGLTPNDIMIGSRIGVARTVAEQSSINIPRMMDGATFYERKTEAGWPVGATEEAMHQAGESTDWLALALRRGFKHQHNLSFRGAGQTNRFYVSANLSDNKKLYALIKELRLPVHELLKEQVIKGIPTWIHVAI